ncbi:hypothetical protein [Paludibaculum fermentans]|uniref:hypothetical protein n=1 Tax=Paludibaculum fermentans TaxID=1473598 RepID=UPI003EC0A138
MAEIAGRGRDKSGQSIAPKRAYFSPGQNFELLCRGPRQLTPALQGKWEVLRSLLEVWSLLGSLGGRTRFGFGAVQSAQLSGLPHLGNEVRRRLGVAANAVSMLKLGHDRTQRQSSTLPSWPEASESGLRIALINETFHSLDEAFEQIRTLWKPHRWPDGVRHDLQRYWTESPKPPQLNQKLARAAAFALPLRVSNSLLGPDYSSRMLDLRAPDSITKLRRPSRIWFKPVQLNGAYALVVLYWRWTLFPAGSSLSFPIPLPSPGVLDQYWTDHIVPTAEEISWCPAN